MEDCGEGFFIFTSFIQSEEYTRDIYFLSLLNGYAAFRRLKFSNYEERLRLGSEDASGESVLFSVTGGLYEKLFKCNSVLRSADIYDPENVTLTGSGPTSSL